ncbi:MAG: hypothetical protein ACI9C1_001887 [Candidatus Aldehydirespiratoraceae bacterium]
MNFDGRASIGHSLGWMGQTGVVVGPRDSHVTIVLSTFGGATWLPALLSSIEKQTHTGWSLLVRDDGSTDQTLQIIEAAASRDARIRLVDDTLGNLGPAASFMALLDHLPADEGDDRELFAFCDQDDVWHDDKLAHSIAALPAGPLAAVYTDATVTDAAGVVTTDSALAERGVPANRDVPFGHLLVNNAAIGATLLGTAALGRKARSIATDEVVLMHDWWVALVASHEDSLACLRESTISWRRHEGTVTGATPEGVGRRADRRRRYLAWSVRAACLLAASDLSGTEATQRAAASLAVVDPEQPSLRALAGAWRHGVRAWPARSQGSLLFSVVVGRTNQ